MAMKIRCWRSSARSTAAGCFKRLWLDWVVILLAMAPNYGTAASTTAGPKYQVIRHELAGAEPARHHAESDSFVERSGHQFILDGKPLYLNGANIYWLMTYAADESRRPDVADALQEAAGVGVSVVRTWAFADGTSYRPLQVTPGVFDESTFQGLDYTISEAKVNGIRVILSLVNNYADYGGKAQYVSWANTFAGAHLTSDDDFFSDATIRGWFKDYIKTILTRVNTITGVAYCDEPAIFAWELMNEPRCSGDTTGNTFQAWLEEMAAYVKSLDANHLLEVGLEGFYSSLVSVESVLQESSNPGSWSTEYGVDFLRNHQTPGIDFATVHAYPDSWISSQNETEKQKQEFMNTWISIHIDDCETKLDKPVLFAEFGRSSRASGYNKNVRISDMSTMYDAIYNSASQGGAGAGALLWHLLTNSTHASLADGYEIVLSSNLSIALLMQNQSSRLSSL